MPSNSMVGRGSKVTSAPESISIATSASVAPLSGFRNVTLATGAGRAKSLSSYAGIGWLLSYFFDKVGSLLRMRQARTAEIKLRRFLHTGHDNIYLRFFRQPNIHRQ